MGTIASYVHSTLRRKWIKLFYSRWIRALIVVYVGIWLSTADPRIKVGEVEEKILKYSKVPIEGQFFDIGYPSPFKNSEDSTIWKSVVNLSIFGSNSSVNNDSVQETLKIWTLMFNKNAPGNKMPLVLVHGLCASAGLWALNVDAFAQHRAVYAVDLLGFGRSSRPSFDPIEPDSVIEQHVEGLEAWRKAIGLEKFILLGHSMGGYLSAAYELKYPNRVGHLVLLDPWGIPEKPANIEHITGKLTWFGKIITKIAQNVNPLALMRAVGPLGPALINTIRGDIVRKFGDLNQNGNASVAEYLYYINAQEPTGEEAFGVLMDFIAWAKIPILTKWKEGTIPSTPVSFIYGEKSWIRRVDIEDLDLILPKHNITFHEIRGASHHVYADGKHEFHRIVNSVAASVDQTS